MARTIVRMTRCYYQNDTVLLITAFLEKFLLNLGLCKIGRLLCVSDGIFLRNLAKQNGGVLVYEGGIFLRKLG